MYLKLSQGMDSDKMRDMNKTVLKIFEYAAQKSEPDLPGMKKFLGPDGHWLLVACEKSGKLREYMEALFSEPQTQRQSVYEAFRHDMDFDKNTEEKDGFVFLEDSLDKQIKQKAKQIVLWLYENSFKKKINGERSGYKAFKKSLFFGNVKNPPDICPSCLAFQSNLSKYGEMDHFFPKKEYPALIFHPVNLTCICSVCNGSCVKGQKNPGERNRLWEIYIPYLLAAEEEVVLRIQRDNKGGKEWKGPRIMMVPDKNKKSKYTDKRIDNLDSLFNLSDRWTDEMYRFIMIELDWLKEKAEDEYEKMLRYRSDMAKEIFQNQKWNMVGAVCLSYMADSGLRLVKKYMEMWKEDEEKMKKGN